MVHSIKLRDHLFLVALIPIVIITGEMSSEKFYIPLLYPITILQY
jgi:hypothetical protein